MNTAARNQQRRYMNGGHAGKPKRAFRTQAEADEWLVLMKQTGFMNSYPVRALPQLPRRAPEGGQTA